MNQFTKKELSSLRDVYEHALQRFRNVGANKECMASVIEKLNKMIERHCDHEYIANACINCCSYKCVKCMRFRE